MVTRSGARDNAPLVPVRDWLIAGAIAMLCMAALQLPYTLGYLTAAPETMYTGLLVNVEDANYLTIIQRGSEGAWSHSLRFTSEPDAPAHLYLFYLALGHLARVLGLDATAMWHVARAVMTLVTFGLTFGFICAFVRERGARWVAFLFAILGAGFDWVALPWETLDPTSATPADLKMADAHLFHSALTFPHYLASIALLLILFWCAVRLLNENHARSKIFLLAGIGACANVGVALVYPFFVLLACGVLAGYLGLLMLRAKRFLPRETLRVAALIAAVVPVVAYYANALASSELLWVWSAQSQTLSPNPLHYLLTFAPYLILAGLGLWRNGLGDNRRAFLWVWVLVVVFLVYAPFGPQRRFLQGVQIPLAILATCGLYEVFLPRVGRARWFVSLTKRPNYSAEGIQRLLVVLVALTLSISSVYQWISAVALATAAQPYPIFRPRGEVAAMDWLRGRAAADDVVLSAYLTGSYLPLRSGARVYLGHVYETVHFQSKQRAVDKFFSEAANDVARKHWVRENGIRYVFYGEAERALGAFDPAGAEYLQRVFANKDAVIYRVREN